MSIRQFRLSHTLALTLASTFMLAPPVFAEPNEIVCLASVLIPKALPPRRMAPCM